MTFTTHEAKPVFPGTRRLVAVVAWIGVMGMGAALAAPAFAAESEPPAPRLFVASKVIWNNRTIPVCWETAGYATEKGWVKSAVEKTWAKKSQIVFSGWGSCKSTSKGIRIQWLDIGPHTDALGSNLDGKINGMTLNPSFANWSTSCQTTRESCIRSIAVHEFGHALGFAHEQNRDDTPSTCTDPPQGSDGDTTVGAWDLSSVMNYCNPLWNNGGKLSLTDVKGLRIYYGGNKRADFKTRIVVGEGFWGKWYPFVYCPSATWAGGYAMRVESAQGSSGDDTALNAVKIACKNTSGVTQQTISPCNGFWGTWYATKMCPANTWMNGGQLRIESPQGSGDDTAANSLKGSCTGGTLIQASGGQIWGSWNSLVTCGAGQAVCGISVRVEDPQGSGDDTALNGVQFDCCNL